MDAKRKGAGEESVHVLPTWFGPRCGTANNREYYSNCMFDLPQSIPRPPLSEPGLNSWYFLSTSSARMLLLGFVGFVLLLVIAYRLRL